MSDDTKTSDNSSDKKEGPRGGCVPLGFTGSKDYVYSINRQCVVGLDANDMTPRTLTKYLGAEYLWAEFPKKRINAETGEEETVGIDFTRAANAITNACEKVGLYSGTKIKGAGVWRDPHDSDRLIINGSQLWDSYGAILDRADVTSNIYVAQQDIDLHPDFEPANDAEVAEVFDAISSWNFKVKGAAKLMLGWIANSPIAGALYRRPHVILTGAARTGKTTLQDLIGGLMGGCVRSFQGGSTDAGIKQQLASSAVPFRMDEAEAHHNIKKMIITLRSAYSIDDGALVQGTADQKGKEYRLNFTALLSMINPPELEAADRTRFAVLELDQLGDRKGRLPEIAHNKGMQQAVGRGLRARMIREWPRHRRVLDTVCRSLMSQGLDARAADTLGALITGYYVAVNSDELSVSDAKNLIKEFDINYFADAGAADDEGDALERLLDAQINVRGDVVLVSDLVERAMKTTKKREKPSNETEEDEETYDAKEAKKILNAYGITVLQRRNIVGWWLGVASSAQHPGLRTLYRGSQWETGGWGVILGRLPGAEKSKGITFASQTKSGVFIPMKVVRSNGDSEPEPQQDDAFYANRDYDGADAVIDMSAM